MAQKKIKQDQTDGLVEGPASSTDNTIARFDGTTGKLIQNSAASISDDGTLLATNVYGDVIGAPTGYFDDIQTYSGLKPGFAAGLNTNNIYERTAAAGVTADGVLLKDGGITATATVSTLGQLLKINADSGNPEFDFTEGGTVRAKTYYDVTNNRLTFQNNEVNTQDALYFTDHVTTTGNITVGTASTTAGSVATIDGTQTLTNKRITPRVSTITSTTSVTYTPDNYDHATITALAANLTINAHLGTPTDGQKFLLRIKDNGTARTLTWDAIYRAIGVTLPTTTVASKTLYVGMVYNSTDTKWDVIAVSQEV